MKPKFRNLAAAFAPLSRTSLIVCASLCAAATAQAADGTWTSVTSGGTWSNAANWSGAVVADGSGSTANLSTADLPAGAFTLSLDTNRTIKSINFGDADGVTTAGTWSVTGTTTLTLDGTTPTLTAGVATTIAPVIAGTAGMTKSGAANLILTNANTLSGGITVSAGQLTTKNGTALGSNTLTLANGTTYRYERTTGNATTFQGNAITLSTGASATITNDNASNGYSGIITGDATSTITIGATGAITQCSFSLGANTQQFGPMLGRVEIFDGASLRFSSTSGVNNGGASAIWDTNTSGNITTRNAATVHLGSLVGNGTVSGSGGATGTAIFSVGARNEDCTFGGVISDGNTATARFGRLTKVGTGKFTLTGANTYTGQTNVDVGTLEIGNGGTTGSIGATNVNVAASANLHFNPGSGQVQTISGVVAGAGTITKLGAGRTNLTGVNTFSVSPIIEGGILAINADTGLGAITNSVTFQNGSGKLGSDAAGVTTSRTINVLTGATGGFAAIDPTDSLQVDGSISGDGALEIGGSGLVTLTADNTYLGNTTVASGVLSISNTSGSATSSGSVSVTGGTLAGTGSIAGSVAVSTGAALKPGAVTTSSSSVGTVTTGNLDLNGGSTLHTEFASTSSYDTISVNGNLSASGASIGNPVIVDLRLVNSVAKWTTLGTYNLIQYSGTFSGNANDLFEVSAGSTQPGLAYTFAASGGFITLTIAGAAPSEWNVDAPGNWSTAGNWLNGVPSGAGSTAKFSTAITSPVTVTLDSARTVGVIQFNNDNAYTIAGTPALTLDSTSGNAGIEILVGSHEVSTPLSLADSVDLSMASGSNVLTLSGDITGSGGINNATSGGVVLSGTNTFTGNVSFTAGSLAFENGSLGAGNLSLANSTLTWASGNTEDISSRSVTISGSSVTLNTNGNDVVLANSIGGGGSGALLKTGAGKLTYSGNATYTGTTTVNAGTLQLGSGGSTGLVSGTITNNSVLGVNLADASTFSNLVVGSGSFVHSGTGALTLTAQNTFTGTTSISSPGATLILSDSLNLQNSTLNHASTGGSLSIGTLTAVTLGGLSGGKNLVLENSTPAAVALTVGGNNSSTTYSGGLGGTGSVTKNGTGVLTLTGANTYTGNTVANAGDLDLSVGGSITSSPAVSTTATGRVVVSGGSLSATTGNFGVGSPGLLVSGGTASFSGAITAAGSTGSTNSGLVKVTGGTLTMASLALGRGGLNASTEPTAAPVDTNLYISGGAVTITGNLNIGTANNVPNSSVVTRVDGGSLTVGGGIVVGLNNGGRWSMLDVNGGDLFSTATAVGSGIVLGGAYQGNAAFLMRAGTATTERIQFGQAAVGGAGVVNILGGTLYMGSGGFNLGTTGAYTAEIRLTGGTLAAKAPWTTSFPINVAGTNHSVIKTANAVDSPFDITLNGPLTGTGYLDKEGSGTLTLGGGHSYSGTTTVYAGTLKVQTRTFDDNAMVDVQPGATLNLDFTGGDRIGSLRVDGTDYMDPGTYGAVGSGATTELAGLTGSGLIYIGIDPPVSAYASWASAKGLTVGVNDGPNDDPDNDGVENQLEFVLGGNPLASSTSILPTLSVTPTSFIFTFTRNDDSEAEVALAFEHGNDLSGWTPIAIGATSSGSVNVSENAADPDTVTVTISRGTESKIFGRLRAVK